MQAEVVSMSSNVSTVVGGGGKGAPSDMLNYVLFDYWEEQQDPRSRGMPGMHGGPWPMMALMAAYVYFCAYLGPALMKNRPAFELRKAMLFYNITTVLVNGYFFVLSVYYLNFGLDLFDFRFPSRTNLTEVDFIKARLVYLYILTKLYDLMGLHLYHHSAVPLLGWLVLKIAPTASVLGIFPFCNTLVHIIMYSYYALSSFGPAVQPYLWWKKYITQLQLYQFAIYAVYSIVFFYKQEGYPIKTWGLVGFPQPFIFFYLFWSFYRRTYNEKKQLQATKKAADDAAAAGQKSEASTTNNNNNKKEL